jgi:hypothetical protein
LFLLRHLKLIERLPKVGDHRLPLRLCDVEVFVRFFHRPPRVLAGPASHFTHERRHLKLQARLRHTRPRLGDGGIGIQRLIDQQPLDEVVDNGGDAVNTSEPVVQGLDGLLRGGWPRSS